VLGLGNRGGLVQILVAGGMEATTMRPAFASGRWLLCAEFWCGPVAGFVFRPSMRFMMRTTAGGVCLAVGIAVLGWEAVGCGPEIRYEGRPVEAGRRGASCGGAGFTDWRDAVMYFPMMD